VNKQNSRIWGTELKDMIIEKAAHPIRVTVWCAISAQGLIGPYIFEEDGKHVYVDKDRYQNMINNYFVPTLKEIVGSKFDKQVFMQDGASPRTSKLSLSLLSSIFGDNILSHKEQNLWP